MKFFDKMIDDVNENYLTRYVVRLYAMNLIFIDEFLYFEVILINASSTNFCYFYVIETNLLSIIKFALMCI